MITSKRPRAKKGEPYREHQVNAHLTDRDFRRLENLMQSLNVHRAALTHQAIVEYLDRHRQNRSLTNETSLEAREPRGILNFLF